MGIVFITTHLVMTTCMISILYLSFKHDETFGDQEKLPATKQFYTNGLKFIEVIATTGYRIAASILISYLK